MKNIDISRVLFYTELIRIFGNDYKIEIAISRLHNNKSMALLLLLLLYHDTKPEKICLKYNTGEQLRKLIAPYE